jgi:conjugative relaxase-like TrwC/TraI family protein
MISCKAIASAGGAAKYHLEKNGQQQAGDGRAEYYQRDEVRSAWAGQAADLYRGEDGKILGAGQSVGKDDFVRALEGRVVDADGSERALGKWSRDAEGSKTWEHRAGWDLTFSAPKSVSIASEVFGRAEVRAAHENAVAASIRFLEAHAAQTRIDGETVATGNLLVARFEHSISRELDPQTHTHCIVVNATYRDASGKWYSLSNEQLLQWRSTADLIYKNEMASALQAAGYRLDFDGKGGFEIAGLSREQLAEFSTRSQQIDEALIARGIDPATASFEARQAACLDTRAGKDAPDSAEAQRDQWLVRAQAAGIEAPQANAEDALRPTVVSAEQALAKAIDHLTEREMAFNERALYGAVAQFSHGTATLAQIDQAIGRAAERGQLILRNDGMMTTPQAVASEQWAQHHLAAGRQAHEAIMTERDFRQSLAAFEKHRGFELSAEQSMAARAILTGNDRFQGVNGLAGTGKTTMLAFVREAAEAKGWQVQGFSNGAEQAAKLQGESGIHSTTTARFLLDQAASQSAGPDKDGPPAASSRTLNVMDEASLSGQREFNQVIQASEQAGARTVFLGDKLQHQGVEAGRAFEKAQAHMPMTSLGRESIRRQTTEQAKETVGKILDGRHDEAIRGLPTVELRDAQEKAIAAGGNKAAIHEAGKLDNQAVIARLAKDYADQAPEARQHTLVITATNADRRDINSAIRDELKAGGQLGEGKTAVTLERTDRTAAQLKEASAYQKGDVVQFQRDYKTLGVEKGQSGEVQRTDARLGTLAVKLDNGREITVQPARHQMQAYTRAEKEFAAGDRIRFTQNHREPEGLNLRNGQQGTVERFDGQRMDVRMDNGRQETIDLDKFKHVDHAYTSTSHASQGQTVDRVMIHHNTESGRHGDRETYVNATRAREEVTVYTQDADRAAGQAGVALNKEEAMVPGIDVSAVGKEAGAEPATAMDRVSAETERGKGNEANAEARTEVDRGSADAGR